MWGGGKNGGINGSQMLKEEASNNLVQPHMIT